MILTNAFVDERMEKRVVRMIGDERRDWQNDLGKKYWG
jgi:hypothetical protein